MEVDIEENTVLVLAGASGDLARKNSIQPGDSFSPLSANSYQPGLSPKQERRGLLPPTFRVIGFAPDQLSHDDFHDIITSRAKKDSRRFAELLKEFTARCSYVSGHEGGDQSFRVLQQRLDELGEHKKEQHRLFYLALPPAAFESVSAGFKKFCHSTRGKDRLIIEKPFGHDAQSSKDLQSALNRNWSEDEIFRIDHYLGKEVVNNLLALRFGNEMFGAIWNKRHIHDVEISMCEAGGAEGRGSYFNSSGTIRDIMQNHMMQILALLTMERPKSFTGQDLGSEKTRVLSWMPPIDHQRTLIGQYVKSMDGTKPAFQDEEDVPSGSKCVTFCAAEARIENERWSGVPILLKAGKALDKTEAIVTINFRQSPNAMLFENMKPNRMTIRVQPNEGIFLRVNTRVPDLRVRSEAMDLDMSYQGTEIPEAYEALFLDALRDVQYRRVTADEVQVSWAIFTPMLRYLEDEGVVPREYPYGSSGPPGLDEFVASCQQSVPK